MDWFILLDLLTVFTTDNAHHNASSNTFKNHFHGTSISFFQHLDSVGANHQIMFDLLSKVLGGQRDLNSPHITQKLHLFEQ